MVLEDEQFLEMGVSLFIFVFLFVLGEGKHPGFFILCGIVGIAFGIRIQEFTGSAILAYSIFGISLLLIVFGLFRKPAVEEMVTE